MFPTNTWPVDVNGVTQVPTQASSTFDADLPAAGPTPGSVTDYYFQASCGNYIVLGDFLPNVIHVPCSQARIYYDDTQNNYYRKTEAYKPVFDQITSSITTASGKTESAFDLMDIYNGNSYFKGLVKPLTGNNKFDAVIVVWRNNGYFGGTSIVGGFGLQAYLGGSVSYPISTFSGAETLSIIAGGSADITGTVITEYMHALFGGNNWHSGGGAGQYTFMLPSAGFCTSSNSPQISLCPCGFDRNHLGWKFPSRTNLINGLDATTFSETNTDINIQNYPNGGTFIIRDFMTQGEAIRIKLPHINHTVLGDVKNQYIWLENHQMISMHDHGPTQTLTSCNSLWQKGIWSYMQVGKDRKVGLNANDDIFVENQIPFSDANALGSFLQMLSAEGRFDFHYRPDLAVDDALNNPVSDCIWGNRSVPVDKALSLPNPLTGFHDTFNAFDWDGDGEIRLSPPPLPLPPTAFDRFQPGFSEVDVNGVVHHTFTRGGDDKDAYIMASNHKISIGTNPTPTPLYTYTSNGYSNIYPQSIASYENRTIFLNNLSIEMLDDDAFHDGSKAIKVKIRWDDGAINNDTRWCGNIVLQNDINDPQSRATKIDLAAGKNIFLDRGQSPTQHKKVNGSFTEPTVLKLKSGTVTTIAAGASIKVRDDSYLEVENGANVDILSYGELSYEGDNSNTTISSIQSGANVHLFSFANIVVKNNHTLHIDQGANVTLDNNASIIIEPNSKLILGDGQVFLNGTNANIYVKGTLEIPSGVDLTMNGTGFYRFGVGNQLQFGNGSSMDINGGINTHKIIELDPNAELVMYQHQMKISNGTIKYGVQSKTKAVSNVFDWSNILTDADPISPAMYGIEIANARGKLEGCRFKNFNTGVYMSGNLLNCVAPPAINIKLCVFEKNLQHIEARDLANTDLTIQYSTCYNLTNITFDAITLNNCNRVTIDGATVSGMQADAIHANMVNQLIVHGGVLANNLNAIEATDCNIFVNGGAMLYQNSNDGILLNSTQAAPYASALTIGDWGCGQIFSNSNYGIEGTDFILYMDAAYLAQLNHTGVIQPNAVYNNAAGDINITYGCAFWNDPLNHPLLATTTITNNYWGGGNANWTVTFMGAGGIPMIFPPFVAPFMDDNPIQPTAATCTFGSNPGEAPYDPTAAGARMSNTPVEVPNDLDENNQFPTYAPAGSILAEVYRRMLDNNLTEASQLLTDYLSYADPAATPDNNFSTTQSIAALLANQLYNVEPCIDNGGGGSSNRVAHYQNLKKDKKKAESKTIANIQSNIKAQPNPFNTQTTLSFNNEQNETFELKIYNTVGQAIFTQSQLQGNTVTIQNQNYSKGMYWAALKSPTHTYRIKLVVE